ncbi:hypothetical protein [Sphingomonas aerophila]|uniref:Uncharacterized protein n=1 Tax=Sphingomonas aerophila TaxID=1344948 RepID=A0A7W9EVU6_9SPHN|nr:hypothetical protein [Sphingomonas aerophila]MBB5716616.1 hypothetical protein [Sphingomonas aerophila]
MNDREKVRTLLTSAGMLMEDASARLILQTEVSAVLVGLLRETASSLLTIATAVEVIERRERLSS